MTERPIGTEPEIAGQVAAGGRIMRKRRAVPEALAPNADAKRAVAARLISAGIRQRIDAKRLEES